MSQIDKITETIGTKFRTFGGGQRRKFDNPVAAAFADRPLMFAANVDVKTVVIAVLEESGFDDLLAACTFTLQEHQEKGFHESRDDFDECKEKLSQAVVKSGVKLKWME